MIYNVVLVSGVQHNDSVIHISTHIYVYISILFPILFPYRLLQNIECSSLCYTVGPCWFSILYIVVCISYSQTPHLSLPPLLSPEQRFSVVDGGSRLRAGLKWTLPGIQWAPET